ncbi:MAG: hypothetical protein EOP51_15810 [Sphingobacteriales bacterium]|nr:MAG: hypothetical protein EOP51_15810 [Sphingobacteriales bacterium]
MNTPRLLLLALMLFLISCGEKKKPKVDVKPTFKSVWGIRYTEVKRRLANGLSFDSYGFQQEPSWRLRFANDDSVHIYSPEHDRFYYFPLTFDHDSAVNMARTWLRVKKVTKDSLVFLVMKVEDKTIYLNAAKLYMTFYADDYINNKLKTTAEMLKRPSKADTAYIRKMAQYVNTHPDTAFAARQPVVIKSRAPNVTVEKVQVKAEAINHVELSDAYMSPEYNIIINKAYDDFNYSFTVLVNDKGVMQFGQSMVFLGEDFKEDHLRVMKGIMNGYLKVLLTIKPGTTLGIPHTSAVILNVKGLKE